MKDKILLKVLLPANQQTYEFRVPFDLSVAQGAQLMARIVAAQDAARYCAPQECSLMFCEGPSSGELLEEGVVFGFLAASNLLVDGTLLALM